MDFSNSLYPRSSSVACAIPPPITRTSYRRWHWHFHCVSPRIVCRSVWVNIPRPTIIGLLEWVRTFCDFDMLLLTSISTPGHDGLGVIGGSTVNFVGLGGCLPEGLSSVFPESPTLTTGIDHCV